jgi:ATP-binding protein involved in chromosome partitioning
MADPRVNIITERLSRVGRVLAVCSGKGGVGKSVFASTLALVLAQRGYKVGLLDIDFTSPSTHLILGVDAVSPVEEKGIIPPLVHDLSYMSIIYYTRDHPTPLRGSDVSNVLIELLAITQWGALDVLVLDLPPGLGDLTLDVIRFITAVTFLLITIPSTLAFETVKKLIRLLQEQHASIGGVVENMTRKDSSFIQNQVKRRNVSFLGAIAFDTDLEDAIGDVKKLQATRFMNAVDEILSNHPEIAPRSLQR